jgi:hypothetical protein
VKQLHRADLYCWSLFDEECNVDFNSYFLVRAGGNVLIDPLPLSAHHEAHVLSQGGAEWVVVTNSDHVRDARAVAELFGAKIAAPSGERSSFPILCDRWLTDQDEIVPGLVALEMHGSKPPGELVLILDRSTLITGDLIRASRPGSLSLLPDSKLASRAAGSACVGTAQQAGRATC